jgi:mycofactocin biosynthetic radical S-adenosylmethionine protein MftC
VSASPPIAATSSRLKLRALALAQPLAAYLELTYRCNWRCVFCYNPRHFDRAATSAAHWISVLDELRLLGTLTVTFTGGEPMAHPGFFEIAEAARQRAFAVMIFTNGALINEDAADRLARLDPLVVELSLHGACAETHDRTTATPGSFDRMRAALGHLRARGVRVQVKTPVTRLNIHELDEMVALVSSLQLPHRIDPTMTPRDDGDLSPLDYSVDAEGLQKTYRVLAELGKLPSVQRHEGGINCGLGRITLAVDPDGNVFPCLQWRKAPLGNVKEGRLSEMWHASASRQEAADVSSAVNETMRASGSALASFPFCPALAFQRTGDPLQPDATHRLQAQAAEHVRLERADRGV